MFDEPSGAFREAARRCTEFAKDRYRVDVVSLPADADQQREQLTRRLAAGDESIDIIGMDVIWTAEFAEAGWIREWPMRSTRRASAGRFPITVQTATYKNVFWATPFTTNVQLLWYRTDRVPTPPDTWDEMIDSAEKLGGNGRIQVQGERYEGLTVLFVSLLASAGGTVLDAGGQQVSLEPEPTRKALQVMKRLATSPAADPGLSTSREDQARLAFETGNSAFMLNYTFVWPSARQNAPDVAANMGWARWPAVLPGRPSRVTVGGIDLAVSTYSRYPELAFDAAECLASRDNQRIAAQRGGLPPTVSALYNDPAVRRRLPFADVLRAALNDAVERPQTPVYGIALEKKLIECRISSLRGYRNHRPVRVGNQAYEHIQNDIYGSVIMAATQAFFDRRLAHPGDQRLFERLENLGRQCTKLYNVPDASLWEFRGFARIHTFSAVMCWAGCDRLARIADHMELHDRAQYWRSQAERIRTEIMEHAYDSGRNTFVGSFGGSELDASLLLLHDLQFLAADDPSFIGTVEAVEKELRRGNHMMRYVEPDDFGAPQNAFNICTFWMIGALAAIGRKEDARAMFEEMLNCRNHLGLLSEDTDPQTGEMWGNFPQTYSMVGIIHSAMVLSKSWEEAF